MAAYVANNILFDTNSGNHAVAPTPALGELIIVIVAHTGSVATPTVSDNNADGKGSYTLISPACVKATSADAMFVFVRNALIGSATATTITAVQGTTTGGGIVAFRVSGMWRTGARAIRQVAVQQNQGAGTPAPVLTQAALTTNMLIGAVFNATSPATMTARTSFTERNDVGYATPTTGLETITRDTGETGTTQTWGSASGSAFCSIMVELDATVRFPEFATVANGDSFTRADEHPVAGNWMKFAGTGLSDGMFLTSNQLVTDGLGFCGSLWRREEYYQVEAFVKIATQNNVVGKMLKFMLQHHTQGAFPPLDGTAPSQDGYQLSVDENNTDEWLLTRIDNGTQTPIRNITALAIASGDQMGAENVNGDIAFYKKAGAGAWAFVGAATDTTYKRGWVGIVCGTNDILFDDFGIGGQVVPKAQAVIARQAIGMAGSR